MMLTEAVCLPGEHRPTGTFVRSERSVGIDFQLETLEECRRRRTGRGRALRMLRICSGPRSESAFGRSKQNSTYKPGTAGRESGRL